MDDPSNIIMIISLIGLVILSALFSGSETSLFSISPAKLETLKDNKVKGAKLIAKLKERPQKMLVVILLGNNLVNVMSTAIATVLFTNLSGSAGLGVATGVMTLAILIFGEVLPKSVATKYPVKFAQVVVYPLLSFEYILYPLIWFFEKVLTTLVGEHITQVSEDEVKAMVNMGAEDGSLEEHEKEFIENVLDFNEIEAEDIMTPRIEIDAVEANTTLADTITFALERSHSRIPVYNETIDNISGFITVKKMLEYSQDPKNLKKPIKDFNLYEFVKIPATKNTYSLLREFKRKRRHMALIFDEHGGVEGIITLEDVIEEIVGEISDEQDDIETPIVSLKDGSLLCDGDVDLEYVREKLDIEIPDYDDKDHLNWIILDYLKRFPALHEVVKIGNADFEIQEMDQDSKRIDKIIVKISTNSTES
jgi:putative hemolysin